jgi:hypothetical protein
MLKTERLKAAESLLEPAAAEPHPMAGSEVNQYDEQPAAPEPETPEQVCERLGIDVPAWAAETREKVSAAQPAAPEPSGFEAWPDDAVALWQDAKNECNAAHLAKESAEAQLAAVCILHEQALNERDAAHLALETAESQLAAVREVVRKYEFGYGITPPMLALKKALTPAPSPGAVGGK